jgi:hypothetical protein
MMNSRAASANSGWLLATVSAGADDTRVGTADGAEDESVWAADADDVFVELIVIGVAIELEDGHVQLGELVRLITCC